MGFRKPPKAPKQQEVAAPASTVAAPAAPVPAPTPAPTPAPMWRGSNPDAAAEQAFADRALGRRDPDKTTFVPFRRSAGALGAALRTRVGG